MIVWVFEYTPFFSLPMIDYERRHRQKHGPVVQLQVLGHRGVQHVVVVDHHATGLEGHVLELTEEVARALQVVSPRRGL